MPSATTSTLLLLGLATTLALAPEPAHAAPSSAAGMKKSTRKLVLPVLTTTVEADTPGLDNVHNWGADLVVRYEQTGGFAFRAKATAPQAASLRWEVSLPGLLAREDGPAPVVLDAGTVGLKGKPGAWQEFSIAFGKHVPPKPVSTISKRVVRNNVGKPGMAGPKGKAPAPTAAATSSALRESPRVYWVRVTALDAKGKPLGKPSQPVRVVHRPSPPQQKWYGNDPMQVEPTPGLKARITRYEPVRFASADSWKRWVVTWCAEGKSAGWGTAGFDFFSCDKRPVGTPFVWDPTKASDKDVLAMVGEAIADAAAFVVDAINWASTAYADIKKFAVNQAVSVIPLCKSACRSALEGGLDLGLAAVGLPPSIPDFDALTKMGEGYLVEVITEEVAAAAPGLPPDLVEEGARALVRAAAEKVAEAADRGPKGDKWFKPDPAYQYHDAVVNLEVRNTASTPKAGTLYVQFPTVGGPRMFESMYVPVPELQPGETLKVPMVLTPDKRAWDEWDVHQNGGTDSTAAGVPWTQAVQAKTIEIAIGGADSDSVKCKASKRCTW